MSFFIGNMPEAKFPTAIMNDIKSNAKIYGVHFDGTNSVGERLYNAKDMKFTPSSTTTAGDDDFVSATGSPFDIKEVVMQYNSSSGTMEELAVEGDSNFSSLVSAKTGQRMIRFPRFYYKRPNKYEFLLSSSAVKGFTVSPMHYRPGKDPAQYAYVSKYTLNSNCVSQTGETSLTNGSYNNEDGSGYTIAWFRNQVRTNQHMYLLSYGAHCAMTMLMLVKYNTLNVQSLIGKGWADTNAKTTTGGADGILGQDGYAASSASSHGYIKCLGIENYYGNIWKFTDGLVQMGDSGAMYCNEDIENITSNPTPSNYSGWSPISTNGAYTSSTSAYGGWITDIAYDNQYPYMMYPTSVNFTSGEWYKSDPNMMINDGYWTYNRGSSTFKVCLSGGGAWDCGFACGPFCLALNHTLAAAPTHFGASAFFLS